MNSRAIAAFTVALLVGCAPPASVNAPAPVSLPVTSGGGPFSPAAHSYDLLHGFTGAPDGSWPDGGHMTFDKAGNLYGATYTGGMGNCRLRKVRVGCGTIFELSPRQHGGWSERILYSFKNLEDGASPFSTLTFDKSGSIYGVTLAGGNRGCLFFLFHGCGTVFELVPHNGKWRKSTLHVFSGANDGGSPLGGLVFDGGTLYGTAKCGGGDYSCYGSGSGAGVFFELARSSTRWAEKILEVFGRTTGGYPGGDLTVEDPNTIFGVTAGSVYMMSRPSSSGSWSETTLYFFRGNDPSKGFSPNGGLVLDSAGDLYGTTYGGGSQECDSGCGVVFEISPSSGSSWTEKVLHTFSGGSDGRWPAAGLTRGADGTLFGTTQDGGDGACNDGWGCGVVFTIKPRGASSTERVLHVFENNRNDGKFPLSAVTRDSHGSLYGSTWFGGPGPSSGDGTVYEIAR